MSRFFWWFLTPPSPCHKLSQILDPPLKVCHTSEQKVNKQISEKWRLPLNNYNHYYILNNNKRPYWVFLIYPRNTLASLISNNSEGDSCSLKFVLCMIKYKIKHKIVNCEKIESVTSHNLNPPSPLSQTVTLSQTPSPPWSVTYFMDGPFFTICLSSENPENM